MGSQRGIRGLKGLQSLSNLTLPEVALFGVSGEDEILEEEDLDSGTWSPPLTELSEVLPSSLKTLTILVEDEDVRDKATMLSKYPGAASLEEVTIMNTKQTHCFSKVPGDGGVNPCT